MAAGIVLPTVLPVAVIVITTTNVAIWAFRPRWYRAGPKLTRGMNIFTGVGDLPFIVAWAVFLPLAVAVILGSGRIVVGVFAVACGSVTIMALIRRESAKGKPWWKAAKTAKTARQAFRTGLLWAVYGLGWLLAYFFDGAHRYQLVMSAVWLANAGLYLVSAVAWRRHERSGPEADSPGRRYLLVLDVPLLAADEQLDLRPITYLAELQGQVPCEAVVLSLPARARPGLPAAELCPLPGHGRSCMTSARPAERRMKLALQHLKMIGFTARGIVSDESLTKQCSSSSGAAQSKLPAASSA
jgi:hypothetical protein